MFQIENPRLQALLMVAFGAVAVGFALWIASTGSSGRGAGKAIIVVGLGGAAVGAGLIQLIWPPPAARGERDERGFLARASWPQKILYSVGGLAGIIAAAILHTMVGGKI